MNQNALPRVLLVDDETNVLDVLSRHLRGRFDVVTAAGGIIGVEVLKKEPPFAVIVSDLHMPKMDGIAFLSHAREVAPDSVRILFTGNPDLGSAVELVNRVNAFRLLLKPCASDALIEHLVAAVRQHELITAERVLLEETLHGSIKALTDLLALVHPSAFGRAQRVKRIVEKVAVRMGIDARWKLEVAAMLSQVGCVSLPAQTVEKLHRGAPLSNIEATMARRLPKIAADLIARIPRLEDVRDILLYQDAAYTRGTDDASGGGASAATPGVGSRILKAALDLDALEAGGLQTDAAIATLRSRPRQYDPAVLDALEQALGAAHLDLAVQEMLLRDVRPGMVFMNDVRTRNNLLLIARGQEATKSLVERLQNSAQALDVEQRVRAHVPPSVAPLGAAHGGEEQLVKMRGA